MAASNRSPLPTQASTTLAGWCLVNVLPLSRARTSTHDDCSFFALFYVFCASHPKTKHPDFGAAAFCSTAETLLFIIVSLLELFHAFHRGNCTIHFSCLSQNNRGVSKRSKLVRCLVMVSLFGFSVRWVLGCLQSGTTLHLMPGAPCCASVCSCLLFSARVMTVWWKTLNNIAQT